MLKVTIIGTDTTPIDSDALLPVWELEQTSEHRATLSLRDTPITEQTALHQLEAPQVATA